MDKTILCDADGVLLNWEYAFHVWLEHHGHDPVVVDAGLFYNVSEQYGMEDEKVLRLVKNFNESASIGFLPALRDSVEYVDKIRRLGYRFHIVTSVSDDPDVAKLRAQNLHKLFGDAIEHVECLPMCASKKEYLSQFKDSGLYWIEDNIQNAEDGLALGLKPLLMEHGYNMDYRNPAIPLMPTWREIYKILSYF